MDLLYRKIIRVYYYFKGICRYFAADFIGIALPVAKQENHRCAHLINNSRAFILILLHFTSASARVSFILPL